MSEEEKEAIKQLKSKMWYYDNIDTTEKNIKIVLNLIEKQQKEIKENQVLIDDIKLHRIIYIDTPEFEEKYVSKDKIREKIEFYKSYGKIKNSNEYVMSEGIEILQGILGEEK